MASSVAPGVRMDCPPPPPHTAPLPFLPPLPPTLPSLAAPPIQGEDGTADGQTAAVKSPKKRSKFAQFIPPKSRTPVPPEPQPEPETSRVSGCRAVQTVMGPRGRRGCREFGHPHICGHQSIQWLSPGR